MSVVLHVAGNADATAELARAVSELAAALSHHVAPWAAIVECASALDAGLFQALQPLANKSGTPLLTVQPTQLVFALRSVLAQLGSPPAQRVLAISLSADPGAFLLAAASLGCATLHIPPAATPSLALAAQQHLAALLARDSGSLVVAYVMKRSRQLSLSVEGMLPLLPSDGLCFMPLNLSCLLAAQQPFDILLQKPTDYLQEVAGSGEVPGFTTQLLDLQAQLRARPEVCVVDPLPAVKTVMDRAVLALLLDGVSRTARAAGVPLRSPKWAMLAEVLPQRTQQLLEEAGIRLPLIVKPQVACGVSEAHQMAFVLHPSGLEGLEVPLPAVAQEYVDHGGLVWKVYAAGDKVFMAQRKSTPSLSPLARCLAADPQADLPSVIGFDSLKSLPTSLPWAPQPMGGPTAVASAGGAGVEAGEGVAGGEGAGHAVGAGGQQLSRQLDQKTAELIAGLLRKELNLTLFGFDIVISDAGELVVVDVNFFPSFKGIPEAPAALRSALLARHREWTGGPVAEGGK